jgi:diacylglycerol kinase (ATP)
MCPVVRHSFQVSGHPARGSHDGQDSPRLKDAKFHTGQMRICVIFNPMAKGSKARCFRAKLEAMGQEASFKMTRCVGDARTLAAESVYEGFSRIVAAGGDGTLNEVLNGIGDARNGFEKAALGLLPLGTVNVYARELGIPMDLDEAWKVVVAGKERALDLARAEFASGGTPQRRWFAQLAGAGLDARAIELVDWNLKKRFGPLAYIYAGLKALSEPKPRIKATCAGQTLEGELVFIGNGRLYGGDFKTFEHAAMDDGLLDVCVFPQVNFFTLARCAIPLLLQRKLPQAAVRRFQASEFTLTSASTTSFELEGELAGQLPVNFAVERRRLRTIVP